jgi:hypothetical protein
MATHGMAARALGPDDSVLCRVGGVAAIILGLLYLAVTALYAIAGAVPSGTGEVWLAYFDGKDAAWWGIAALSVVTDVLFLPLAAALYVALRRVNRNATLAGVTLLVLFVILDLAVTWPNYASLITLSGDLAAATTEAQRAAIMAAATYPASVLDSSLFGVYAILVPALGVLGIGLVMLGGSFSRSAAWVGVLTGILGILSVAGPFAWDPLGALAIPTSVLTTVWVFIVGYKLIRIAGRDGSGRPSP